MVAHRCTKFRRADDGPFTPTTIARQRLGYSGRMHVSHGCALRSVLAACLVLAAPAAGAATLDLRLAAASREVFRGVVQTPGLTGSVRADVRLPHRSYLGARVLNNRSAGAAQIDAWAGVARSMLLGDLLPVTLDGGVVTHVYTGDRSGAARRNLDWAEAYASAGSGPLRAELAFAPDYFGTGGTAWRLAGQLRWPLSARAELSAAVGWNDGDGVDRALAAQGGGGPYADIAIGVSHALPADWTVFGQVTGTSIELDDSRTPQFLIGLRWRWGRQFGGSTGR